MEEIKPPTPYRSHLIGWFTVVLLLLGVGWFCLWFFYFQFSEWTDDAYANGNLITINPAVSGSVTAFFADDTDLVKEGQLLVSLDRTLYQMEYEKQLASLSACVLQVRQLYDTVASNRAHRDYTRIKLEKARFDYANRAQLITSLAISQEDFKHAQDDMRLAEQELKQAEQQLEIALDAAGNTPLEQHPLLEKQKTAVREAYYHLQHCSIYAPATGYIAKRAVDVGERVGATTALMALIPAQDVWVDANFKETQLSYMRIGQPATVTFDLYGSDIKFEGNVIGISSGSGSLFSLIPPQNATGNWIKIVQRLPVRISLNPEQVQKFPVRLGISAEVKVNISERTLPMLAQEPPTRPVATTKVFELDFAEVNRVIDLTIQDALKK